MNNVLVTVGVLLLVGASVSAAMPPEGVMPTPEGVRTKEIVYKRTQQGELSIHISYPKGWKASDKRPAIVFFFGGGWTGGSVKQFLPQAEYLAGRGMVAARADYRVRSRHKVTPDKCVEDAKSAVRWLRVNAADHGIDPDRIVASGGSAGAHLAICTFTTPGLEAEGEDLKVSSKPNLLIPYNPPLDTTSERVLERVGSAEIAKKISPIHQLAKDVPPTIMYFGSEDALGAPAGDYLKKAKKLKIQAEVLIAPGMGHGFFNRPPWLQRTTYLTDQFLVSHGYLTGKPTIELPEGKVAMDKLAIDGGR